MYSRDSLQTSPLVLHNFLHSVDLSTTKKIIQLELCKFLALSIDSSIASSLCSHSCTRWSHRGQRFATFLRVFGERRKSESCYGKTNFRLSVDAQLLRWKIDATLSGKSNDFPPPGRRTTTLAGRAICAIRCNFLCKCSSERFVWARLCDCKHFSCFLSDWTRCWRWCDRLEDYLILIWIESLSDEVISISSKFLVISHVAATEKVRKHMELHASIQM